MLVRSSVSRGDVHANVVADDTTDAVPGINAAIQRAADIAGGEPGKVLLPAGPLRLASTLQLHDDVVIEGVSAAATRLRFSGPTGIKVGGGSIRTLRSVLRDLTVDGGGVGIDGIQLGDGTGGFKSGSSVMDRVDVTGCVRSGVFAAQVVFLKMNECDLYENLGVGFMSDPAVVTAGRNTTMRLMGCRIQTNGAQGALIRQGVAVSINHCTFEGNQREGLVVEVDAADVTGLPMRGIWVTDCYWEKNLDDGGAGAQFRWDCPGLANIDGLHVRNANFNFGTQGSTGTRFNMSIGRGFSTVEYAEQPNAESTIISDAEVDTYIRTRYQPDDNTYWELEAPFGVSKVAFEVWGGGVWEKWTNSATGLLRHESIDKATGATAAAATNSTTLNLGSRDGTIGVGYFTNWIACPVSGTLDKFSMAITSNDSNNAFTVELERRVTAFAANPVLTIVGADVVGNAVDNIGEAVVAGDQFRAIVTVADGATPPEDLNATISLTGVS